MLSSIDFFATIVLMRLFKWFVLAFLVIGCLWFWNREIEPSEKCRNIFISGVYDSYRKQLTPGAYTGETTEEKLANHEQFVNSLREQASDKLVEDVYLATDLTHPFQIYLDSIIPPRNGEEFFSYLSHSLQLLKANPRFNGIEFDSAHEDTFLRGNLPFLQFSLSNTEKTRVLRMAMPVIEQPLIGKWFIQREVAPEFLQFLQLQKNHLYVNLMKRHGAEGGSTTVLESLESKIPSISVITLDKNSPFYWQEEKFQDLSNSSAFKYQFLDHMTQNRDFYWSKKLDAVLWKRELERLIEQVHQNYFDNQTALNQQERQDFIELTYIAIIENLTHILKPTSLNITCKQSMDRGPSLSVLWQWKLGKIDEPQTAALLLAPPLLIRNRPSHTHRIERFNSAAKRLSQKNINRVGCVL